MPAPPDRARPPIPSVTVPKGGGAIRGIGEKFSASAATGTGTMTVPIFTSPGRAGFGPTLTLAYDSGSGNGPFGFGWSLGVPAITRKTDKGLPRYADAEESDVFVLSGAEDLVPELRADGSRHADTTLAPGYAIHRYRPRLEGLFGRIERWTRVDTGETHWRSISRDNVATLYGRTPESRIADPADPTRVFSWLACESFDDRGSGIAYAYAAETDAGIDRARASEGNRQRGAARYLKRIRYGNTRSFLAADGTRPRLPTAAQLAAAEWRFEVVFDYGEGHYEALAPDPGLPADGQHPYVRAAAAPARAWPVRPDPFSSYRSGFEVRTYRRCQRVLMFHHFPELGPEPCLVRATELDYADAGPAIAIEDELAHQGSTRFASFIRSVTQAGFVQDAARPPVVRDGVTHLAYRTASLPPVELEYSKAVIDDEIREVDRGSLENLPVGLDGDVYRWVDLDGEGVSGILTEQAGAWRYKPNRGAARFGPAQTVAAPDGRGAQLLDLSGDGQLDVVALDGPTPGFFERTLDERWEPFRPFRELANVRWDEPNLRFIDLDGDGHADVVITEHEALTWHRSLGEDGFGDARRVPQPLDEDLGPQLVFADAAESVYAADMSGDGLTDLVRIRNGEVCYWPNLGYGRFGAKVSMDDAPCFDLPDAFDQRRVRLADIDGSGTTDIIYIGPDGARLYYNHSGNGWSAPRRLEACPRLDDLTAVTMVDLLANGTACLVWSSPAPADAPRPMRYIDLTGGVKPHLLVALVNNLGAETRVEYASSAEFYLADKAAGRPWVTRLPFPVHVVRRVTTLDRVSRNRFVTRYAYHHGHFDGAEREFRGFGMVEQWDTEELAALTAAGELPVAGDNIDAASHAPPVHTKTWLHTGVYLGGERVSRLYAGLEDGRDVGEYYREPAWRDDDAEARRHLLEDTVLPPGRSAEEEREACRALRGLVLRREVYALDESAKREHPYSVVEQNFTVAVVQRRGANRHAVFFAHPREAIEHHYERNPADPRVTHTLTLDADGYGNVRRAASIAYGRRQPDPSLADAGDRAEQTRLHATCTVSRFTNVASGADAWRTPMPCEARTFELTGLDLPPGALRFGFAEVDAAVLGAAEIAYDVAPFPGTPQKRVIGHVRTRYRPDDLGAAANDPTSLLPLGVLEPLALPGESYTLALTPGLVARAFGARVSDAMLLNDGRYVHSEGDAGWWVPSGRVFYSPGSADSAAQELAHARQHFYLPHRVRDLFHTAAASTEAFVRYDAYDLLVEEARDALGNRVTAGERQPDPALPLLSRGNDYRVLQPRLVMDPNRNRTAVAFDALGLVTGTAVMGKPEDAAGDRLTPTFRADLTRAELDAFLADPRATAAALLDDASTRVVYDVTRSPSFAATLARETHAGEPAPAGGTRIQLAFSYSDGFAREIQRKVQAEPEGATARWVGSGWSVFDNKGRLVRRYEPSFTGTHRFEFDVRVGVGSVLFYDPAGRTVGTLHADHTWEKAVFDPWRQALWDTSDTVLVADPKTDPDVGDRFARLPAAEYLPTWRAGRVGAQEQAAAAKAAIHAGTPTTAYFDSLGRAFVTIAHNRFRYADAAATDPDTEERYRTRAVYDIDGNVLSLVDPLGRVVARYDYDLLGNRLHQSSMEAGERWLLRDVAGQTIHAWTARGHHLRTAHDRLRRPTGSFLREGAGPERLIARTDYGEAQPDAETANLRGRVARALDQAGEVVNERFDFKGNLLGSRRRIAQAYAATIDWSAPVPLHDGSYVARTRYDALNRATQAIAPHDDVPGAPLNVIQPSYNDAGLLERVDVWLALTVEPADLLAPGTATLRAVGDVAYDAKRRRTRIEYGAGAGPGVPGVTTTYAYDARSAQLTRVHTARPAAAFPGDCPDPAPAGWPGCDVQDLRYTYDAAGNVTHVRDDAQQTIYFQSKRVEPHTEYTYDAISRLVEAAGREHLGQAGASPRRHTHDDVPRVHLPHPGDGLAMGRYVERYAYDAAGNLLGMVHRGSDPASPGWTRAYTYDEPSQLEPAKRSNRLTSTGSGATTERYSVGGDGYDAHGNMLRLPQLQVMAWDHQDQLRMTRRQAVDAADAEGAARQGERTWYVYDAAGNRVRKVTELAAGQVKDERLYLGGFEIYRRHGASPLVRETLHVMDDRERIALVETRTAGSEPGVPARLVRHQFGNHLGSVSFELDDAARVVSYEEYSPYGSTTYQAMRSGTEAPKRYRFTGKERDEESGFYTHGARYYAPWLGRWTSCDPAGLEDGLNVYAYVRQNPVRLRELTGATGDPSDDDVRRWMERNPARADRIMRIHGLNMGAMRTEMRRSLAPPLPTDPRCRPIVQQPEQPSGPVLGPARDGVPVAEIDRRTGLILNNLNRVAKDPLAATMATGTSFRGADPDEMNAQLNMAEPLSGMASAAAGVKGGRDRFESAKAEAGLDHRPKTVQQPDKGASTATAKPAATSTGQPPAQPPAKPVTPATPAPAATTPAATPNLFAPLGPPQGGAPGRSIPWVDAGSVKPASKGWTERGGARAWSDIAKHIGQTPDDHHQGVAFYAPRADQSNKADVFLVIKKAGGMQEVVFSGVIGQVDTTGLPGKFGDSAYGTAIESRVNDLISSVTGQAHFSKHGSTTGLDYTPVVPRGTAANDYTVP